MSALAKWIEAPAEDAAKVEELRLKAREALLAGGSPTSYKVAVSCCFERKEVELKGASDGLSLVSRIFWYHEHPFHLDFYTFCLNLK